MICTSEILQFLMCNMHWNRLKCHLYPPRGCALTISNLNYTEMRVPYHPVGGAKSNRFAMEVSLFLGVTGESLKKSLPPLIIISCLTFRIPPLIACLPEKLTGKVQELSYMITIDTTMHWPLIQFFQVSIASAKPSFILTLRANSI